MPYNGRAYHSVRDCVVVPVKLHQRLSGLQPLQVALKPLLMIHCVITRFYLFVKNNAQLYNYFDETFVFNTQLSYI
jgi:hypothetical protein